MTISPEEHDFIGDVLAEDNIRRRPKTLASSCRDTQAEMAWFKSQAFAAYGSQEDVQATFYMGWDAAMAAVKNRGDQ